MKKETYKKIAVICSVTVLVISECSTAQQYVPFPKENTYWTSAHCEYGPTEYRSGIVKTGIFGDTIIHDKVYHKMYLQTKFVHTGNCTTCDFAFDLDSAYYYLAFREKNKKIYVVPTGYNPYAKEYLVYDFTPHRVGDTVKAYPMEFFYAPGKIKSVVSEDMKSYPVKSITRVNMTDGSKRKKYTFDPFQLESWIEGIGSTKFLNPFFQVTDIGDKLLCFSSNGVNYANTAVGQNCGLEVYTCELTTPPINGLSNKSLTAESIGGLNVYPNPVVDQLQLSGLSENGTAHLVNILGIEVLAARPSAKEETIDVSALNPGIYMLQVCDASGNCVVKRLVKE
jgi:hypothetical protein